MINIINISFGRLFVGGFLWGKMMLSEILLPDENFIFILISDFHGLNLDVHQWGFPKSHF